MRKLPLYDAPPQAYIASVAPQDLDKSCTKCSFSQDTYNPCMSADGRPGGVLIIGESPTVKEDQIGRPFSGDVGRYVRQKVAEYTSEPVVYDYALKCPSKGNKIGASNLEACGGYLAGVVLQAQPTRILCLGATAAEAILNRRPVMGSARRGYGWYFRGTTPVPVFFLESPSYTNRNRFMQGAFEDNLQWALTCEIPTPDFGGVTNLVDDDIDASLAFEALSTQPWIAYDVETSGHMHNPDFRLEAVTLLGAHADEAWTWTRESLKDEACQKMLRELFETGTFVTQNGKYDDRAVALGIGAVVQNIEGDTRLVRKMLDPEARAGLEVLAELVGMGGHKEACQDAIAAICKEINRQANPPSGLTPTGKVRKIAPPKFDIAPSILQQIQGGSEAMTFAFKFLDDQILYQYNARDVWTTRALWKILNAELASVPSINRMWNLVTKDANKAVRHIESWGFPVDRSALEAFRDYCGHKLEECGARLKKYGDFNPDSPKQLGELLFNVLKLPPLKLTDSGQNSTDEEALEGLRNRHPIVEDLLTWRKFSKLKGTYGDGMLGHVRADGRIHPSFLLDGAATGRMSSSDPNFQNCVSGDTEVLTLDGWKRLDSLRPVLAYDGTFENIMMFDPATNTSSFGRAYNYVKYAYTGPMVAVETGRCSLLMTPDHRCLVFDQNTNTYATISAKAYAEENKVLQPYINSFGQVCHCPVVPRTDSYVHKYDNEFVYCLSVPTSYLWVRRNGKISITGNCPRANGSEEGKLFKDCFIAKDGWCLLEADFSQLELRIAAALSGDTNMRLDFESGIDIHRNNARAACQTAWGIPQQTWDLMSKDEQDPYRSKIKVLTFSKLYGKSDAGIAYEWGVKVDEVRKINASIWTRYKQLDSWIKDRVAESRRTGEAYTWWNGEKARRRFVWKIADQDPKIREHGERTAYNGPIQGTAADFMTASLWPIVSYILEEGVAAEVICTVHDSVTLHVREDYLKEMAFVVQKTMTSWPANGVPIKVDMKVGRSWGSMLDYKGD